MEAYYNTHTGWMSADAQQHQQQQHQQSPTPAAAQGGDEWGKAGAIDLSDFGLGDLQATTTTASPTSTMSMQHLYQFPASSYFTTMAPYNMIPYGQAAAASSWPQNLPLSSYSTLNGATTSIGSPQQTQQQPQQSQQQPASQTQPAQQPSFIDPSLTTSANGTTYSPPPSSSSQGGQQSPPVQYTNPFQTQQQSQQQQHPHQNMHSPTVLAMSPVYLMHHQAQQQQQQQQPRTLNPQQLTMQYQYMYPVQQHAQTPPMQTNLTATTSNTATPPSASTSSNSSTATAAPHRKQLTDAATFKRTLDRLLSPAALSEGGTVQRLMDAVADHGSSNVTPEMRTELACRIRDNAGNAFFASWARDPEAMVLLVGWLKAGVTGKDEGRWECTIMPLLHVLDRLPLSISTLKEHRLGKLTNALLKSETVSPAIKDMASNISNKWRTLIEPNASSTSKDEKRDAPSTTTGIPSPSKRLVPVVEIEVDKTKKRKLGDGASKPPAKVAVVSSSSSTPAANAGTANYASNGANVNAKAVKVKREKVVVTAVKDAKADASFFSAPKPKPKLPSFKKAPPSAPSTTNTTSSGVGAPNGDAHVAQPNHEDPFQQALKEMNRRSNAAAVKSESSSLMDINNTSKASTPDSSSTTTGAAAAKNSKKRKSVSWAPEGHLEKVRIIEKAVYEDDHVNGTMGVHSIRDLERAEGAAMHIHLFEEAIDWYEPYGIVFPEGTDVTERGTQSVEKVAQEEREKNTLGALYFAESDIPESPGEPLVQIPADQVDNEVRMMVVGPEIQPFFQHAMSVADLVGQLAVGNNTVPAAGGAGAYGSIENGVTSSLGMGDVPMNNVNNALGVSGGFDLSKLDANALSSLAASLGLAGFNFGSGANPAPEANNSYQNQNITTSGWGTGAYAQQQQQQSQQHGMYAADSGYSAHDERDREDRRSGGFRGRGRGAGRGRGGAGIGGEFKSRRRCNYYAQGSCRFGDACHFSHEGPPGTGPQGYYD